MDSYEEIIKNYVSQNADTLKSKSKSKKGLLKFSEAVSRAILERKKSDTGYGDLAESLASAGLSSSGYADYLNARAEKKSIGEVAEAAKKKVGDEAEEEYLFAVEEERQKKEALEAALKEKEKAEKEEAKRLEKEEKDKLAAEKEQAKLQEKLKTETEKKRKAVLSYANSNNLSDKNFIYASAISIGLSSEDARSIAEIASNNVSEKLRAKNVEKTRERIVSERLTKNQAYAYAISLGLPEEDAKALAELAYKMNQDTSYIGG